MEENPIAGELLGEEDIAILNSLKEQSKGYACDRNFLIYVAVGQSEHIWTSLSISKHKILYNNNENEVQRAATIFQQLKHIAQTAISVQIVHHNPRFHFFHI